jgi:HD-like signal output (HDOD) protein
LKKLLSYIRTVPSLPHAFDQIMTELRKEEPSIRRIGEIIGSDLGMTTKVLQLVNSAFFGVAHTITKPDQAAALLGLETLKALVLTVGIFESFEPDLFPEFNFEWLWKHGLLVGSASQAIAKAEEPDKQVQEAALLAGMLHDCGKLILAANLPIRYREAMSMASEQNLLLWQAEKQTLGTSHAEAGAYLLGIWGLPYSVIEAVAFHHHPNGSEFAPLTAVHAANTIINSRIKQKNPFEDSALQLEYIQSLGLGQKVQQWETLCQGVIDKENNSNG